MVRRSLPLAVFMNKVKFWKLTGASTRPLPSYAACRSPPQRLQSLQQADFSHRYAQAGEMMRGAGAPHPVADLMSSPPKQACSAHAHALLCSPKSRSAAMLLPFPRRLPLQ